MSSICYIHTQHFTCNTPISPLYKEDIIIFTLQTSKLGLRNSTCESWGDLVLCLVWLNPMAHAHYHVHYRSLPQTLPWTYVSNSIQNMLIKSWLHDRHVLDLGRRSLSLQHREPPGHVCSAAQPGNTLSGLETRSSPLLRSGLPVAWSIYIVIKGPPYSKHRVYLLTLHGICLSHRPP